MTKAFLPKEVFIELSVYNRYITLLCDETTKFKWKIAIVEDPPVLNTEEECKLANKKRIPLIPKTLITIIFNMIIMVLSFLTLMSSHLYQSITPFITLAFIALLTLPIAIILFVLLSISVDKYIVKYDYHISFLELTIGLVYDNNGRRLIITKDSEKEFIKPEKTPNTVLVYGKIDESITTPLKNTETTQQEKLKNNDDDNDISSLTIIRTGKDKQKTEIRYVEMPMFIASPKKEEEEEEEEERIKFEDLFQPASKKETLRNIWGIPLSSTTTTKNKEIYKGRSYHTLLLETTKMYLRKGLKDIIPMPSNDLTIDNMAERIVKYDELTELEKIQLKDEILLKITSDTISITKLMTSDVY